MWSFGLLGLYLWTGGWFESQVGSVQSWKYNVYPLLFQVLQPEFFHKLISKTFPKSSVSKEDVDLALNLVLSTLRYQREDRPSIESVLDHGLWTCNSIKTLPPDPMWIHKNEFTECSNLKKRDPIQNMSPPEEVSTDTRSESPSSETFATPENIEDSIQKSEKNEDFANFSKVFGDTAGKPVEWPSEYNWELGRGDQVSEDQSEQLVERSDFEIETEGVEIQDPTPHSFDPETHPETQPMDAKINETSGECMTPIMSIENEESLEETTQEVPLGRIRNFILRQWRRINPRSGRRKLK